MSLIEHDKIEYWLPGVLNVDQLNQLIKANYINVKSGSDPGNPYNLDQNASSIDLTISADAFLLKSGSVKPWGGGYSEMLSDTSYSEKIYPNAKGEFELKIRHTYVFKLNETLGARFKDQDFYGMATAKSTIGRMDVIARLIVDGSYEYESLDPNAIDSGLLYLEITPNTFNIRIKEGYSLNQLRLFKGKPENCILNPEDLINICLKGSETSNTGTLSVDLSNFQLGKQKGAAIRGKKDLSEHNFLDLKVDRDKRYTPEEYWDIIESKRWISDKYHLTIEPDEFYILRSKERIVLPLGVAVYCKAMDETLGEMRIHYAGFVHPYFGFDRKDGQIGTPLIFEVRGHNVTINLCHGEKLARLVFYRMSKDAHKISEPQPYNDQELTLSKLFHNWS